MSGVPDRGSRARTAWIVLAMPFRAAPSLAIVTLVLGVVAGLTAGIVPLGAKWFIDGVGRDDSSLVDRAAALLVVGFIGAQITTTLAIVFSLKMIGHVSLYFSLRIAHLTSSAPGIEHFERPDYLRELELLGAGAVGLGFGPRHCVMVLQLAIGLVISAALLIDVNPLLATVIVAAALPIFASRAAVKQREQTNEAVAEDRRLMNELFRLTTSPASARELRTYGLATELRARHRALANRVTRRVVRTSHRATLLTASGWALYGLVLAAAVIFVAVRAADGATSVGAVVLTMQVGRQATMRIGGLTESITQLLIIGRTTRRLLWLEDYTAAEAQASEGTAPAPERLIDGIDFDGVSFRYPGTDTDVLRDVRLHIPASATVALVGANGAGKTTLVKLLAGMYRPTSGRITIDGTDLAELSLSQWRERLAGAFQDFVRPELAAFQAIGVGDLPRVDSRQAVGTALDRAGATNIVERLPAGLETPLGRSFGGADLSVGEWQKLALGRAMMRDDPLVLLFDEPTASLDAAAEHALFERFSDAARAARQRNGAITLLISHRFSTVQMADLIVVIEAQRVSEVGTHAELVRAGGTYASLYEVQAQAYR